VIAGRLARVRAVGNRADRLEVGLYLSVETVAARTLKQRLDVFFPDATVTEAERPFPPVGADEYVAGARLALRNDCCLQIANPLAPVGLRTDPYDGVVDGMTGIGDARAVVQVAFRPVADKWWRRWYVPLSVGESLRTEPPLLPRQVTCTDLLDRGELTLTDDRVPRRGPRPANRVGVRGRRARLRGRRARAERRARRPGAPGGV
jgi:hypothetical protein